MKYLGTKELETERLLLRKVKKEDAILAYQKWTGDKEVCKYTLWNKHESVEDTLKLYEFWEKEYEKNDTFRWIVINKETNEPIGTIDVASKKYLPYGTCEIGYCYELASWGHGYATEALEAVIKYLFLECEADVIFAQFLEKNIASGKVMEHVGMVFEGFLRGRVTDKDGLRNNVGTYSITREEYLSLRYWKWR